MQAKNAFALFLLIMFLSACQARTDQPKGVLVQYPATNLKNDDYQPDARWKLVWADEFDGDSIDANNWNRQVVEAGRFNDEWQRYTDGVENAYVDNGCLVIRAMHEGDRHGKNQYTSARLNTATKQTWRYGKIAARIQLPHGRGVWPAFWMLGANIEENGGDTPWPQTGEVDIMEFYGSKSESAVEANIHYAGKSGAHANMGAAIFNLEHGKFSDKFHVFEIEWDANKIAWFVDGQQFASASISGEDFSAFHKRFFILLNLAIGGRSAGRPDNTTRFPQVMYVDWVRVYQKS